MNERPCILVDTREQTPLRFSDSVTTERATLSVGDYSVAGASELVAIERKSLPDLVACCGPERDRFLDCMRRLREVPTRAVIVEASLECVLAHAYRSRLLPQSVVGTVLAIHADYDVATIWAGDSRTAAQLVERLLLRVLRKKVEAAA